MQPDRPNIVLVITDQQRGDSMPGRCPAPGIHMPHLSWLAARGTLFSRAYCTAPICSPARGSLLTGRWPHETGLVANYVAEPALTMPPDLPTIGDLLAPAGYRTAYTGKWHLPTGGDRRGFRDFVARLTAGDTAGGYQDEAVSFAAKVGVELGSSYASYLAGGDGSGPTGGGATKLPLAFHPSTLQANRAADFIRDQRDASDPFVLVYSCIEPHPMGLNYDVSPSPFDRMYDPRSMPLSPTRRQPDMPAIMRHRNANSSLKPTDPFDDPALQRLSAGYYGGVSYVDHLTGILLEALLETDQWPDTMFIFTSDHGEMLGDHRSLKKGAVMFESLVNVPLLITLPGAATGDGRLCRRLVSHIDLLPTMLQATGVAVPDTLHGVDLGPLLAGGDQPVRDAVVAEYHSVKWGDPPIPLRCWCTEDWKYVATVGGDDELYHLADDANEERNLATDPDAAATLEQLRADLAAWCRRTGDRWPEVVEPPPAPAPPHGDWDRL